MNAVEAVLYALGNDIREVDEKVEQLKSKYRSLDSLTMGMLVLQIEATVFVSRDIAMQSVVAAAQHLEDTGINIASVFEMHDLAVDMARNFSTGGDNEAQ